jgi:hypothetical protein
MKKLILLILTLITFNALSQDVKLKLNDDSTKVDINGGVIDKGDDFIVPVLLHGNANTTARALYFDFEYQNTAFDFVSVVHTGTGGNGGVLPSGANITLTSYLYPGYSFATNANNTTTNGNANYNTAAYNYTQGGPKTIIRAYLNWATTSPLPYANYGTLLNLRFKLKTNAVGDSWNPIKMNFAAVFNQNGGSGSTLMEIPLTTIITQNPDAKKYVKANIDLNPNIDPNNIKVAFVKQDNTAQLFTVTSTGSVNIIDSLITGNTQYKVIALYNMDDLYNLYNSAVTVSDYTSAQSEFISQNLDGTFNNNTIISGAGYRAADVNRNDKLDGGDLVKIFAQAVNVDKLVLLPEGYTAGSNGYKSLMTFKAEQFNAATPSDWASIFPSNIQPVYTYTTLGTPGIPETINIKYLIDGDINRSLSSAVVRNSTIIQNSVSKMNRTIAKTNVSVNLKNTVVTSNKIEIPVVFNTNGNEVSGLQFQFSYDKNKIKFEELINEMPNSWYMFANNADGVIKFGAVDKDLKSPVKGELIPFKVKFSTLQNGLDINSYIRVSPIMDAASKDGSQLGIDINTDVIKLTGYNNF